MYLTWRTEGGGKKGGDWDIDFLHVTFFFNPNAFVHPQLISWARQRLIDFTPTHSLFRRPITALSLEISPESDGAALRWKYAPHLSWFSKRRCLKEGYTSTSTYTIDFWRSNTCLLLLLPQLIDLFCLFATGRRKRRSRVSWSRLFPRPPACHTE